jgi:hypothetical protein
MAIPSLRSARTVQRITTLTTLVLSATSPRGNVTRVLQVMPSVPKLRIVSRPAGHLILPVIHQFTAVIDPQTRERRLVWSVAGAKAVTLNGSPVAPSAHLAITPSATGSYMLQATNALGAVQSKLVLIAGPAGSTANQYLLRAPGIQRFTLIHSQPGQPYRLVWQTTNATSVALNGRPVAAQGSLVLQAPLRSNTYLLAATNSNGRATAQVSVVVRGRTSP